MGTHQLFVFSNPADGREDEYNEWYDQTHLGEVIQVPGFTAGQRFRVGPTLVGSLPHKYLAVYEIEADDPGTALEALGNAIGTMKMSDSIDLANAVAVVFTPVGERMTASKAPASS